MALLEVSDPLIVQMVLQMEALETLITLSGMVARPASRRFLSHSPACGPADREDESDDSKVFCLICKPDIGMWEVGVG